MWPFLACGERQKPIQTVWSQCKTLLGHQPPLSGEHSRLSGCPESLDHHRALSVEGEFGQESYRFLITGCLSTNDKGALESAPYSYLSFRRFLRLGLRDVHLLKQLHDYFLRIDREGISTDFGKISARKNFRRDSDFYFVLLFVWERSHKG